jgi:hypothetical protein
MQWSGIVHRRFGLGLLIACAPIMLNADTPVAAQRPNGARLQHHPIKIHHIRDGAVSSTNWSGYAVTGATGSITDAKASWRVPAIANTCPSTTNQYSSFWVGIDGYSDNSVEQIGTDSDCQNGVPTYYAWFEFYPHPLFIINSLTINPGDTMSAEVKYSGKNQFTVSITDVSTGQSFSTTTKIRASLSSAEWISEAPSSSGGVLPLADFNFVDFGYDYTGIANTSVATMGGKNGVLGSFGANLKTITMVSEQDGTTIKAQPSALSQDGTSFFDTWHSSGPWGQAAIYWRFARDSNGDARGAQRTAISLDHNRVVEWHRRGTQRASDRARPRHRWLAVAFRRRLAVPLFEPLVVRKDVVAYRNAFTADKYLWPGDEFRYVIL